MRDLTTQQRRAVDHVKGGTPLLIIAGAGTGKTNTLAHRVAHLIASEADPRRIMLLTFSRRAAAEMQRRVERITAEAFGAKGGMITGEERLRENITDVYGGVIFYEGRPAQMQVDRTDAIVHEMADIDHDLYAWTSKELPGINAALEKKKLPPIKLMTRSEWDASNASEAGGSPTATEHEFKFFERD